MLSDILIVWYRNMLSNLSVVSGPAGISSLELDSRVETLLGFFLSFL